MKLPQTLVTTYLEMTSPAAFRPAYVDAPDAHIQRMGRVDVPFYRFLYRAVGENWRWRDRLGLSDDELKRLLSPADVDVLYVTGVPAGFIEMFRSGDDTEIVYFGLRPAFTGQGLGKHLLSHGIQAAWDAGTHRIWLHTCNLDSPHALENYRKRGFTVFDVQEEPLPDVYR